MWRAHCRKSQEEWQISISDPLKQFEHLHRVENMDEGIAQQSFNFFILFHKFIILSQLFKNYFRILRARPLWLMRYFQKSTLFHHHIPNLT